MFDLNDSLHVVFDHPLNKQHKLKTFFRICWWKLNQWFFHFSVLVPFAPNIDCLCQPSSSFASLIVYTRWPEYYEMKYVLDHLKSDSVFVDVGAGLGDFSLLAASKISSGQIHAFEPNREALKQLQQNVAVNSLQKKVTIIPKIVSDHDGKEFFAQSETSEVSSISTKNKGKSVLATSLDYYFRNLKNEIEILKIDVEGAELRVLKGAKKLIQQKRIRTMLIELNPKCVNYGYTREDVLEYLNQSFKLSYYVDGKKSKFKLASDLPMETVNIIADRKS